MNEYFPKQRSFQGRVKVDLNLSKNATGVDASKLAKEVDLDKLDIDKFKNVPTNLSNLKSKVDKLVPLPVDLSKLSDVVKIMLLKKMHVMLK